eukprot:TRINITY_DN4346_c0_g1_i1.p1 TRINITY_DN4346_c0_g1~~TRINITY_DN4346_c0_g1_i1.p1  ORF type:complete len:285 (-),score=70.21 TRINITY_DN4346_c0_g1_i1:185-1039(-)
MLLLASAPLPHTNKRVPILKRRPLSQLKVVSFLLPSSNGETSLKKQNEKKDSPLDEIQPQSLVPIQEKILSNSSFDKENDSPSIINCQNDISILKNEVSEEVTHQSRQELELDSEWSFWYDKYPGPGLSSDQYKASLHQLGSFSSIPEFWKWINNLRTPEQLGPRTSYHMMKKGIYPLWEDEANSNGGEITVKIDKSDTNRAWITTLVTVIGEQFSNILSVGDEICGVSVNVRRNETCISIWNRSAEKLDKVNAELAFLKSLKGVHFKEVSYKVHKDELAIVSH